MLGIVVALPWELKSLTWQAIPVGTCSAIKNNLLVARSGIGSERAYAASVLLAAQGATGLLSWGYAAALDDRLTAGSVLLPERIVGATGDSYAVNSEWHRRLHQILSAQCPVGTDPLVESAVILQNPREKQALARRTEATATDMESAAQARLAQERRLPFAVVRTVLDTASTCIPQKVMQAVGTKTDISVGQVLSDALLRPTDWIAIIKLSMQFNAARKSLKKIRGTVLEASLVYLDSISLEPTIPSRA
jgi:adenosylhomocysteine nucleosidase